MEYIVFDLEWNQACFCKASVRKELGKLPFRLTGEIIQIGAVRVEKEKGVIDTFKIGVKPRFFSVMDKKITSLTGIDQEMLSCGINFPEALQKFYEWSADVKLFFSWGPDDVTILRQNLQLHQIAANHDQQYFDLQKIFSMQTGGKFPHKQISLKKAVEHFKIDQSRIAHDALNDAYDAAYVSRFLELKQGIADCIKFSVEDPFQAVTCKKSFIFHKISSKDAAFREHKLFRSRCPECELRMANERIIKWKRREYILLSHCQAHGSFFVKVKFEKDYHFSWTIRKEIYKGTANLTALYREEARKHVLKIEEAEKNAVKAEVCQEV